MSRAEAAFLWAMTWVAEFWLRIWHLWPRRRSVFG